ncbi:hypothetical protein LRS74_23035 [Streptomyces sp. LX-29]|uniref:hypothetical protein n=1 Tax=Streptomyces sp. LX-29 TaxID=2900152 RepID=UPI00240D22CD|nr:hypothetical protein [Streptomyces sp. LX-29]WFB09597.1 hypothetical protein LRS74_23035 [Streptomyces sp. LX-29]
MTTHLAREGGEDPEQRPDDQHQERAAREHHDASRTDGDLALFRLAAALRPYPLFWP